MAVRQTLYFPDLSSFLHTAPTSSIPLFLLNPRHLDVVLFTRRPPHPRSPHIQFYALGTAALELNLLRHKHKQLF
jgi:hypothetical protein